MIQEEIDFWVFLFYSYQAFICDWFLSLWLVHQKLLGISFHPPLRHNIWEKSGFWIEMWVGSLMNLYWEHWGTCIPCKKLCVRWIGEAWINIAGMLLMWKKEEMKEEKTGTIEMKTSSKWIHCWASHGLNHDIFHWSLLLGGNPKGPWMVGWVTKKLSPLGRSPMLERAWNPHCVYYPRKPRWKTLGSTCGALSRFHDIPTLWRLPKTRVKVKRQFGVD